MRVAILMVLLSARIAAQTGSIEGIVFNQASAQPLPGVHVRLFASMMFQPGGQLYGAMTDAEGHFSLATLPPGTYTVDLERTGFLQVPGTAGDLRHTELTLHSGEHLTGQHLAMSPLILISGRVTNPYGDPVPDIPVQATKGDSDPRAVYQRYSAATTNERGQFRLFTVPGKYYLLAGSPNSLGPFGAAEIRSDGTSELTYTATYYPDSPDLRAAATVEAKAGAEVIGLEIHIRAGAVRRNLTLSGTVAGIPPGGHAEVSYQFGTNPGPVYQIGGGSKAGADGSFTIENLPPGYVRLLAESSSGTIELQSEYVELHLMPPGASNIQLTLAPGGTVTGILEMSTGNIPAEAKLTVKLSSIESHFGGYLFSGPVDPAGAFRIAGVPPGHYHLDVEALPETAYVKAILLDNAPSRDGNLDFSRGVHDPRLKITIGREGAQISGEVREADGGAVLHSRVQVFLVPAANQIVPTRTVAMIVEGRYLFQGLPPGSYKLYAAAYDALNRESLATTAESVQVTEGQQATKDLKVVGQEEHANQ